MNYSHCFICVNELQMTTVNGYVKLTEGSQLGLGHPVPRVVTTHVDLPKTLLNLDSLNHHIVNLPGLSGITKMRTTWENYIQ